MWAAHRKFLILAIVGAVLAAIIAVTLIATLYHSPSCTDNTQNQGEEGVDCGGPCSHLCTAGLIAPQVRFVRQLSPQSGRTDVLAYIENKNKDAAVKGAAYTLTLYGTDGSVIKTRKGTMDLPPSTTVPLYISNVYTGPQPVARAFLTFDTASLYWYRLTDARPTLSVTNVVVTTDPTPRITATVNNPLPTALFRVPVVVGVFDGADNVIAASQTLLTQIPPQGGSQAVFTWNTSFSASPVREEVTPLLPLP